MNEVCVLGIESSCDETSVAIYSSQSGLLGHRINSQIETHRKYNGVVPEIASRAHIECISQVVEDTVSDAMISINDITHVAYTAGPGLFGSLLVGSSFAQGFAYSRNLPTVGVHHLEAHLFAAFLEEHQPSFPFLGLIVSGGHTILVLVRQFGRYQILGQTLDDAAGESFDKVAKLLGLPYPGIFLISKIAKMEIFWF